MAWCRAAKGPEAPLKPRTWQEGLSAWSFVIQLSTTRLPIYVSHFHHRPTASASSIRRGAARAVIILIHTALIIAWEGALHSGTSASAIKVACTPISSLISDKCLGFGHHWSIRSAHSRTHSHTHTLSLTHSWTRWTTRAKITPRGALCAAAGGPSLPLSHTVGTRHQLVVVQGFFYVLVSAQPRRGHVDLSTLHEMGWGKEQVSAPLASAHLHRSCTHITHKHKHHTPLPAVVVRSVLMASLRHMLVFGGHHPHRVRRSVLLSRAAVLPCSH